METVVVNDAPPHPSKIYTSCYENYYKPKVIKRKKIWNLSERGKGGGGVLFHVTLVSAMLKWPYQMAVKVFSVNLVILKNKIMYFWLDIE